MRRIVKAIDLQPGDVCVGPSVDFTEKGTVKSTVVVDAGVQVNWEGGTTTTRHEDFGFEVKGLTDGFRWAALDALKSLARGADPVPVPTIAAYIERTYDTPEYTIEDVHDALDDAVAKGLATKAQVRNVIHGYTPTEAAHA